MKIEKILIIRFSSIGDIVLTSPIIRCIKKQIPEVEIHYLTKECYKNIVSTNPYITKIHTLKDSLSDTIALLKAENYSYIVDLHNNLRSTLVKSMLRCPAGSFPKLNIRKWIYVKTKNKNVMPNIHIVDRYFSAVKKIGVTNDNLGLDFFGEEEINIPFGKYTVIVCGATHTTKQIPPKHIAKLAEKINGNIVLVGDKHDAERLKSIDITGKDNILNMCGKCTLAQSAYIVKNADIVITADTGLMHIAAAYKKDIITIWGNTTPQLGMYPYIPSIKNKYISIEVDNLPCRPCSKIGYNQCPKKDFKCMNNINLSKVIEHTNNNLL